MEKTSSCVNLLNYENDITSFCAKKKKKMKKPKILMIFLFSLFAILLCKSQMNSLISYSDKVQNSKLTSS